MSLKRFIHIGNLQKSHGLDGLMRMSILDGYEQLFNQISCIYVKEDGQMLPYFIEYFELIHQDVLIKVEEVDSPQEGARLASKDIYVREDHIESIPNISKIATANSASPEQLIGYKLLDEALSAPAIITDVLAYPSQYMLLIHIQDKECLLPLVDQFIKAIHHDLQEVHVAYPEDIYHL